MISRILEVGSGVFLVGVDVLLVGVVSAAGGGSSTLAGGVWRLFTVMRDRKYIASCSFSSQATELRSTNYTSTALGK